MHETIGFLRKHYPASSKSMIYLPHEKKKQTIYSGGKASHAERWQLFEEFMQCHEDWAQSTLLASIRTSREHERRGQYSLLSKEVSWM